MNENLPKQKRHGGATSAIALALGVPAFAGTTPVSTAAIVQ
jgi:hypothetical protein